MFRVIRWTGILISVGLIILLVWMIGRSPTTQIEKEKTTVTVVASFYPLAEFARQVGGEDVDVVTITPAGVEPHDFEPTAKDVALIERADLFLINGGGVDRWATRLASDVERQGGRVFSMHTLVAQPLSVLEDQHDEPEETEGNAVLFDEHFWLSPRLAIDQVSAIRAVLSEIDPVHADAYRARADLFTASLKDLDRAYVTGLASCQERTAVTSHAAFAYMAREYGFTQLPITGLSPDEEPSAGELARLVEEARARNIRYIFFETLVSPELAEIFAREIGAQTLVFNPLEGLTEEEQASGMDYLSVMRDNLRNLQVAMVCTTSPQ